VFKAEPDWRRLPAESPEVIHRLLLRRLQKDRSRRLKSADAVRIEAEEAFSLPAAVTVPQARVIQNPRLAWIVAAITTLVFASLAIVRFREKPAAASPEMRLEINTPSTPGPLNFAFISRWAAHCLCRVGRRAAAVVVAIAGSDRRASFAEDRNCRISVLVQR